MTVHFVNSFNSEWLKTKRSAASWLVVIGGCFIPLIMLAAAFVNFGSLKKVYDTGTFWQTYNTHCWQFMALFLLPMGVILATSLITQLEYKNNTWKQLYTTPQKLLTIFFTKLAVIVTLMLQFFLIFNIGIYLSGIIPCLLFREIPFPKEPFPFIYILQYNAEFFLDCLPVIALQYLISLHYKNFLVAVGVGMAFLLAALFAVQWEYGYIVPYTYCMLNYLGKEVFESSYFQHINIHFLAVLYFLVFTIAGYILYITKKEKG